MRDHYLTPATTHALARHQDLRAEAERAQRLALAASQRTAPPHAATVLRRAVAGLGTRRAAPSLTTTASAAT